MIRSQYAVLAEYRREGSDKKVDLLGLMDRINTSGLPTQVRNLVFLALLVTDSPEDIGTREVLLKVEGPAKTPLFQTVVKVDFKASDDGTWLSSARLAFEMQGMPLKEPGKYMLSLEINSQPIASHPFTVALTSAKA